MKDRDHIAGQLPACNNRAQLLHRAIIGKPIPLATVLTIAEVLVNTLWRRAWQPHSRGGTQDQSGRLPHGRIIPYYHAHSCLKHIGTNVTDTTPLADNVTRIQSDGLGHGGIEAIAFIRWDSSKTLFLPSTDMAAPVGGLIFRTNR